MYTNVELNSFLLTSCGPVYVQMGEHFHNPLFILFINPLLVFPFPQTTLATFLISVYSMTKFNFELLNNDTTVL